MQFLPLLVDILAVAAFSTGTLSGDKVEQCQIAQASLINFPELKPILLEQILSWQQSPTSGFRGPLSASIKQLLAAVECLIAPPEGFIADHGAAKNLPIIFRGISKFLASMDVNFCLPLQVTNNICSSGGDQASIDDVPNLAAAIKEFLESRFASDESQLSKFLKDLVSHGSTNDKQYREHRLSGDRLRGYCLAENQVADWQNLADRLKETFQPSVVCGAGQSLKCGEASNLPLCLLRYATIASLTKWTCDTLAWKKTPLAQNGTEIKAILQTIDSTIDNGMKTASGLIETACSIEEPANFNASSIGLGRKTSDSGTISDVQRPHGFFGNPKGEESNDDYLKNSTDTASGNASTDFFEILSQNDTFFNLTEYGEFNITNHTHDIYANSKQSGNLTDSASEHHQHAAKQTAVELGLPVNRRVRRSNDGDGKDQDPASLEQADATEESDQEQDVPPGWGSLDWPKPNFTVDLPQPYQPKPSFKPYQPKPNFTIDLPKPSQPKPGFTIGLPKPSQPKPGFTIDLPKPSQPKPGFTIGLPKPSQPKPGFTIDLPKPSQPKPGFTVGLPKPYQPHTGQPRSNTEGSTENGQTKRRFKRDDDETNDKDPEQTSAATEDQAWPTEDPDQDPDFPPGWGSILPKGALDWAKPNFTVDLAEPHQPQTEEPELDTGDQGRTVNGQMKHRVKRDDDTNSKDQDPSAKKDQAGLTEDPDQDPNLPPGWGSLLPKGALDWTKRNFTAEDIEEPKRYQEDKPAADVESEKKESESDGKEVQEKELSRPKRIEREAVEEESPMRLSTILSGKAFLGGDKAYRLKARQSTMKPDASASNHRAAREAKKEVVGEVESFEEGGEDGASTKQPRDANADGEKQSGESSYED